MEIRETVRKMTQEQLKDIFTTIVGAIPDLSFDEAQELIGNKKSFVADIRKTFSDWAATSVSKKLWKLQMASLRERFYSIDEAEVPLSDGSRLNSLAILVDYNMPINLQCYLLGIRNCLKLDNHRDLHLKPEGRWGWIYGVDDGSKMLGVWPNSAIKEFKCNNRRGLMTMEGLALYRQNRAVLKDHNIVLSGSFCVNHGIPVLCLMDGNPTLTYHWDGERRTLWGVASAER